MNLWNNSSHITGYTLNSPLIIDGPMEVYLKLKDERHVCDDRIRRSHWNEMMALNIKSELECNNLKNLLGATGEYTGNLSTHLSFVTRNLGKILTGGGFVYFRDLNMVCDRNFVLMMKDTTLARCNSLLSLSDRADDNYEPFIRQGLEKCI